MNILDRVKSIFNETSTPEPWYSSIQFIDFDNHPHSAEFSIINKACISFKAKTIGTLPGHVFTKSNDKREQVSHPLDRFFKGMWNPTLTADQGHKLGQMRLAVFGNFYVRIEWRGANPHRFWPMENVTPQFIDGKFTYYCSGDKFTKAGRYLPHEVIHIKTEYLEADGLTGRSPVKDAARSINMSVDLEKFYDRVINQGQHAPGTLEVESALPETERNRLRDSFRQIEGTSNAGRVRILPKGVKYHPEKMTMLETDLTNQQKWILKQIARAHGLNAYLLGEMDEMKYANGAEAWSNYCRSTVAPELVAWESALNQVLDNMNQFDKGYYVKYNFDALMRADIKSRYEAYAALLDRGVVTLNQVLHLEDMPSFEGGDVRLVPMNMALMHDDGTLENPASQSVDPLAQANAVAHVRKRVEQDGDTPRNRAFAAERFEQVGLPSDMYDQLVKEICNA